ncbi:hypothetical protein [Salinilacihabitans rarus]|uniref:hypothetical protein n=1 Tax=Salinilacihabitans rarus TaxID=2961596 RepID=UPI0020C8AECB|nr:hypothetical protein [Salinilacihabitans rarus]
MVNPARVDAVVDLAYGALIILAIGLIATVEFSVGIAFGLGVFSAYILHVVWKMARFDPDWMTRTVEETVGETVEQKVEETVGETVEQSVEKTVGETVEQSVEKTVGEQIETVQAQVEAVDERVDRRPRQEQVEELIDESAEDDSDT